MNAAQKMVKDFHRTFNIVDNPIPTDVTEPTKNLRINLIQEEFDEVKEAMANKDLPNLAKEIADLLYVVYGAAVAYGIDMEPVFAEVHNSNMSMP